VTDLPRTLTVDPDPAAVADRAARLVVDAARAAVSARGRFTLALTGGSSPLGLYDRLMAEPYRAALDWRHVEVFCGDERAVPPDDPRSNYGSARAHLLASVPVPAAQVHRMAGERPDLEAVAREYEGVLCTVAGPSAALDLVLLGVGADGHIFSLYPGCPQITAPSARVVALRNPPMDPAVDRVTFTPTVLEAAREVIVLAHGAGKAQALAWLFDPTKTAGEVPAKLLARATGRVSILADRAAAGALASA
jgi:6-phosphogluconolactonase